MCVSECAGVYGCVCVCGWVLLFVLWLLCVLVGAVLRLFLFYFRSFDFYLVVFLLSFFALGARVCLSKPIFLLLLLVLLVAATAGGGIVLIPVFALCPAWWCSI